jgi:predicted 2-oxoglutarate/Fe(II)-dependent dioxygenase YbiX
MLSKFNYWYWNNLLNNKDIKKINKFIECNFDFFEKEEDKANDNLNPNKKTSTVKIIYFKKIKHLIEDVIEKSINVSRINFGYDIWYPSNMDTCNLNIYSYKNLEKYDWHTDETNRELIDIKMTILINLSLKKYEGGNFYLFKGNEIEVKELNNPGNVIMFKSHVNHKVTPVTKGERRTLALFLYGPAFK